MAVTLSINAQKDRAQGPYTLRVTKEHWPLQFWLYDLGTRQEEIRRALGRPSLNEYRKGELLCTQDLREWGTFLLSHYQPHGISEIKKTIEQTLTPDDFQSEDILTHMTHQMQTLRPLFLYILEDRRLGLGLELCGEGIPESEWDTLVLPGERSHHPTEYPIGAAGSKGKITGRRLRNKGALKKVEARCALHTPGYIVTIQVHGTHFRGCNPRDDTKWASVPEPSETKMRTFYQELYDEAQCPPEKTRLDRITYNDLRTVLDID